MEKKTYLNLGCGKNIFPSWENYDKHPVNNSVKQIDLESFPYPFKDDYADKIMFSHILEHLYCNKMIVMQELHRILKSDGVLYIKLPLYSNVVKHTNGFHGKNYLNSVLGNGKYDMTTNKLFILKSFSYNFYGIWEKILGNIIIHIPFINRLDFLLYGEGIWELNKNVNR